MYILASLESWALILFDIIPLIRATKEFCKLLPKPLQGFESLGGCFYDLSLRLKYLPPFEFRQYAHDFSHAPARRAEDLQAIHTGDQESYAIVADHANALRIAVESLKFEPGEVDALELFGRIHGIGNLECGQSVR